MCTIAVTGASGYIGSHVVTDLLNKGANVIALDCRPPQGQSECRWVCTDILSSDFDPSAVFDTTPDVCLHLAWRNGFVHNAPSHIEDLSAHYRFLNKMIDYGVERVAVMGTMHEIGYWEGMIDEHTPCNPISLYGIAKDSLRRAMQFEKTRKDFSLQWLRGFYIYGDDFNSQSIFGKLLRASASGQKTFPFTSGVNQYDFVSIHELARMISACVLQDEISGIINCCSGKPVSLADRVQGFIDENDLEIELDYGAFPDRPYDSPATWGDSSKIDRIMSVDDPSV